MLCVREVKTLGPAFQNGDLGTRRYDVGSPGITEELWDEHPGLVRLRQ